MNNTEQRIAELQKQLDELKASLEKKEDRLWVPQIGESYWFVDNDAEATTETYVDSNISYDRVLYGNFFKTKEQAERHAKRLKLYNKLWRLAEHLNGDWVPDWNSTNVTDYKYYIIYVRNKIEIDGWSNFCFGMPVFRSKELAEKAISMLTDEEKEIFKNIYKP